MDKDTKSSRFPSAILTVCRHEIQNDEMEIVDGALPEDLQGHLFMLASAGFEDSTPLAGTPFVLPSLKGSPTIAGDGMMFRFDFHKKVEGDRQETTTGQVWLTAKVAGTPSQKADIATFNLKEYQQFKFTDLGVSRLSTWLGVRNVVNTAWLPMKFPGENPRLLVTLDAGRPYEIDPVSLEVATPIGWNSDWVEQIVLKLPFGLVISTAHPYFDPRAKGENGDTQPVVFSVNHSRSLKTMLAPIFKSEDLDRDTSEIIEIARDYLQRLKRLLTDLDGAIAQSLKWQKKSTNSQNI